MPTPNQDSLSYSLVPLPEEFPVSTVVIVKATTIRTVTTATPHQNAYGCVACGAHPIVALTLTNVVVTVMAPTICAGMYTLTFRKHTLIKNLVHGCDCNVPGADGHGGRGRSCNGSGTNADDGGGLIATPVAPMLEVAAATVATEMAATLADAAVVAAVTPTPVLTAGTVSVMASVTTEMAPMLVAMALMMASMVGAPHPLPPPALAPPLKNTVTCKYLL